MKPNAFALSVIALVIAAALALLLGPEGLGLPDVDSVGLRGSRVALAILVGAGLSAVGAALQALLRNPLADPFVLGVSGGAAMGAALATALATLLTGPLVVGLAWAGGLTTAGALLGALLASLLLLAFLRLDPSRADGAILVGVVVNAFSWSVVAVVRALLPANASAGLSVWLIGTLTYPSPTSLIIAAVSTVVGVAALWWIAGSLAVMRAGDDDARRLGIPVERIRLTVVTATTLLVGVAVSTTGVIGFVGLLVPHAVRRLFVDDDRAVIPLSAICGGALLCGLDGVARAAFALIGSELAVGALCALLGAPAFALLLLREVRSTP